MSSIPHNKPNLGKEEELAAQRVIRSGWLAQGDEVKGLENDFCNFLGLPNGHSVAVSSGTAALYLALWALDAKNKKIAFPSYVCASLRYAVGMVQAEEVLIDTEENTPNISIQELNNSECPIAIVPHMFGVPVEVDKILSGSIIEDCCQAIGSIFKGNPVGVHGDIGIFSFYATKLMTTGGQGGMVVSKNKSFIDAVRDFREFDMRPDKKMRFNFQMTDLQASIGREQLKKLPILLARREEIFNMYVDAGLDMYNPIVPNSRPIRYRAILKTENPNGIIDKLSDRGVRAIIPIEDWELLGKTKNALRYTKENVSLPVYPNLTNEEVRKIINILQ